MLSVSGTGWRRLSQLHFCAGSFTCSQRLGNARVELLWKVKTARTPGCRRMPGGGAVRKERSKDGIEKWSRWSGRSGRVVRVRLKQPQGLGAEFLEPLGPAAGL